jgi:hypothetical protein
MAGPHHQLPTAAMEHCWFDLLAAAPRESDVFRQAMEFYLTKIHAGDDGKGSQPATHP